MNGNGSGIDKNAPLETVAVAHEKEDDGGRGREKREYEDPEEKSPHEEVHRERKKYNPSMLLYYSVERFSQDSDKESRD